MYIPLHESLAPNMEQDSMDLVDDTQKEARRRRQSAAFLGEDAAAAAEKEQEEPARKKAPSPSWADPKEEEEGKKRDKSEEEKKGEGPKKRPIVGKEVLCWSDNEDDMDDIEYKFDKNVYEVKKLKARVSLAETTQKEISESLYKNSIRCVKYGKATLAEWHTMTKKVARTLATWRTVTQVKIYKSAIEFCMKEMTDPKEACGGD